MSNTTNRPNDDKCFSNKNEMRLNLIWAILFLKKIRRILIFFRKIQLATSFLESLATKASYFEWEAGKFLPCLIVNSYKCFERQAGKPAVSHFQGVWAIATPFLVMLVPFYIKMNNGLVCTSAICIYLVSYCNWSWPFVVCQFQQKNFSSPKTMLERCPTNCSIHDSFTELTNTYINNLKHILP